MMNTNKNNQHKFKISKFRKGFTYIKNQFKNALNNVKAKFNKIKKQNLNFNIFQHLKMRKISSLTVFVLSLVTIAAILTTVVLSFVYCGHINNYKRQVEELQDKLKSYNASENSSQNLSIPYQSAHPDMYAPLPIPQVAPSPDKTVYLTFDDGPSDHTDRILDILDSFNVKATFFLVPKDTDQSNNAIKRMSDSGQGIGVHSFSHVYKQIYSNVDAFLDDYSQAVDRIKNNTGTMPEIMRFPGGSLNIYDSTISLELISEMLRRGYVYYDWNVDSLDASQNVCPADKIVNQVVNGVHNNRVSVVLMHDANMKTTTVDALPKILTQLKSEGYTFKTIDRSTPRVSFSYPKP